MGDVVWEFLEGTAARLGVAAAGGAGQGERTAVAEGSDLEEVVTDEEACWGCY